MVRFFHVARTYGAREVLSEITLSLGGEPTVISGAAGAGKSVMLRLLCGFESPSRGWITVDGLPLVATASDVLAAHRRRLAIVPQRPLLVEDRTALQNVALALEVQGVPIGEAHERAAESLVRVGCEALADERAETLSEGQRRLVSVARAIARDDASLVLADEPAAGLEPAAQERVGAVLTEEAERGATVILASQQPGLPGLRESRVVFLDDGRVAWDSRRESASEVS